MDIYEPHWWRGFIWRWDSTHQCMSARALTIEPDGTRVLRPVHFFSQSFRNKGKRAATERWREAITEVLQPYHDGVYESVDGIPWEIHAIEDEEAWLAAVEAYEVNRV